MRSIGPLLMLAFVGGCHPHDHPEPAHDEAAHGHAHDPEATAYTDFSDTAELFAELPPLVIGRPSEVAAHLTWTANYRPVTEGRAVIELGEPAERFEAAAPAREGIFVLSVRPTRAGRHALTVRVESPGRTSVHRLGEVTVYPDAAALEAAHRNPEHEEDEVGGISFLKEQQWSMDFGLAVAERRQVRPAFEAYGTLRPRADGEAVVTAPVPGRVAKGERFPRIGLPVERGEVLLRLTPRLAEVGDEAALTQAVRRSRIALRRATRERERLDALLAQGALPERRVVDARFAEEQARATLETAERRHRQARQVEHVGEAGGEGAVAVRAPLDGTVVSVDVAPGAFVDDGTRLLRVVDLRALWLHVHVAETHVGELDAVQGVWFEVEGLDGVREAAAADVVTVGGVLDERTRTLPLVVRVQNPGGKMRVGMFAKVHVLSGPPLDAVTVPAEAVLLEGGLPIVYVQRGGETFERRVVRRGVRDGPWQAVEGVAEGERVVSRGAYAVRLAAASGQIPAHGHHH